ncbi:MAG: branched-chain amino acid ABC transporter permease [Alphaproteobacteria bacterium]|nr:branched-chain amino acid ABC transporter permease [Alphaproteobacteria bacterium]
MRDLLDDHWQTLLALVLLAGFALSEAAGGGSFYISLSTRVAILAIAGIGLNIALGYGGMVSFGHAAFFGLGGYAAGVAVHHAFEGSNFLDGPIAVSGSGELLTGLVAAGVTGLAAALFIGVFSLRTSGIYFIMITLAFAQMLYYFAISFPTYGGEDGLPLYSRATLLGLDLSGDMTYFTVCYLVLVTAVILSALITGSRFGAVLNGLRENETRMIAIGFHPFRYRLTAFMVSAAMTAVAGALYVHLDGFVSPSNMSWHRSGDLIVIVILGGVARTPGPIFGAAALIAMETVLGDFTERWQFFLGLVLLGIVLFARGGLSGLLDRAAAALGLGPLGKQPDSEKDRARDRRQPGEVRDA